MIKAVGLVKIFIGEDEIHNFVFDGNMSYVINDIDKGLSKNFDTRFDNYFKRYFNNEYTLEEMNSLKLCLENEIVHFFNLFESYYNKPLFIKKEDKKQEFEIKINSFTNSICKKHKVKVIIKILKFMLN